MTQEQWLLNLVAVYNKRHANSLTVEAMLATDPEKLFEPRRAVRVDREIDFDILTARLGREKVKALTDVLTVDNADEVMSRVESISLPEAKALARSMRGISR